MKTTIFKTIACLTILAGITLTSCSKDDIDGQENNTGGGQTQYEKGYLSMSIMNSSKVKAAVTEPGIDDEAMVNNVIVVLFDPFNGNRIDYRIDLGTGDGVPSNPTSPPSSYEPEARQVDVKPYKLAVFINPPDDLDAAITVGGNLSGIQSAVAVSVEDLIENTTTSGKYDNFLMSNFAGLVDVAASDIKSSKEEAELNRVSVSVERAVAKVIVTLGSTFVANSPAVSPSDVYWQVDVINKETYWMRKQTKMLNGSGGLVDETAYTGNGSGFVGVLPANRDLMYAESPGFSQISAAYWDYETNVLSNTLGYSRPTPYSKHSTISTSDVTISPSETGSETWAYVTENTMRAEEQWEDVTTSVVVKAEYRPATTSFNRVLAPSEHYYVVLGRVFSGAELDIIADTGNPLFDATNTWPEIEAVNPDLAGFQTFIQKTATKNGIGASTNYTANSKTVSDKYADSDFTIIYNYDDVNYYNVPIRHYSDILQGSKMAYGRYGVVRNNVYKVTINKIDQPGDITIPERKDPDDKTSWLGVEFEILEWVIREQGVDL